MKFDPNVHSKLVRMLGEKEASSIFRMSKQLENENQEWQKKLKSLFRKINKKVVDSLNQSGSVPDLKEIDEFLLKHAISIQGFAFEQVDSFERKEQRLGLPKGRTPRSLKELREMWDAYRKRGKLPPRVRDFAQKIKKRYIEKCQSVFERSSSSYREGKEATKVPAQEAVEAAFKTTFHRAKTIVETETTRYYNKARVDLYNQSPDVTHYLFLAIRDHRTTKWCKTRHGLVYKKDDVLFDSEKPPVHWNCRSEVTPLTPLNPKHRALIDDKTKSRRNNSCEPLPKGWNS